MWPSASLSSSRRRVGSTSSRRSCARTSARASSAREQRLQLLQRDAEQVFQAHHLAQALDLGRGVEAVLARRAARAPRAAGRSPRSSGSCAAWCRPGARRRRCAGVSGAERRAGAAASRSVTSRCLIARSGARRNARSAALVRMRLAASRVRRAQQAHAGADAARCAASTHSATCMLAMNGASFSAERPLARPEKIANSVGFGHRRGDDRQHEGDRQHGAGVLQQRARARGDAAAVRRARCPSSPRCWGC